MIKPHFSRREKLQSCIINFISFVVLDVQHFVGNQFDFHMDFWALPNLFKDTAIHFNILWLDHPTPVYIKQCNGL